MKTRNVTFLFAGIACSLLPLTLMAASKVSVKKTITAPNQYKAVCGMVYSAADAKKNHYICPMDGQKMTAIKPAPKSTVKHPKS